MQFVECVLQYAHLPDVFRRIRLVQQKLHAPLVLLTLYAKQTLVVDQIGNVAPSQELRTQIGGAHSASADYNPVQAGADQHLAASVLIPGQEALLSVSIELLRADDVVDFSQLLSDASQRYVLRYDGICQRAQAILGKLSQHRLGQQGKVSQVL